MATSYQNASAGRPSWKSSPRRASSGPTSAAPLRWFLFCVVLVLLAGFGGLAWWLFEPTPRTYLVTLKTGETDLFSPSVFFEEATLEVFETLNKHNSKLEIIPGSIEKFESILDNLRGSSGDKMESNASLVVYVSAQGVSLDGTAYLLGSGFDVSNPEQDRYPINDLIDKIHGMDAASKLLVLDCARQGVLPRAGMLLNEFSWLVEQQAQQLNDPRCWILTAAGGLETSPLGLAAGRSFLGGALGAALEGQADGIEDGDRPDQEVSLAELEQFVRAASRQNGVATPQPRLIPCVEGAQNPADLRDTIIVRLAKPASPAGEPEAAGNNEAGVAAQSASSTAPETAAVALDSPAKSIQKQTTAEPASQATNTVVGTSEDGPTTVSDANEKIAASTQDPQESRSPILQAWQRRDLLQQRWKDNSSREVTPIACAPLLWTKLNAELLAYHLKQLERADARKDILTILARLEGLVPSPQAFQDDSPIARARHHYRLSWAGDDAGWNLMSAEYREAFLDYQTALLDFRYYLFRATQYVRWHRAACCAAPQVTGKTTENIELLLESLSNFDARYRALQRRPLDSWKDADALLGQIDEVRKQAHALDRQVEESIHSICTAENDPLLQRKLEIFVATDLVTADQRESLLDSVGTASDRPDQPRKYASEVNWKDVFRHAGLECRLAKIVDPELELAFDPSTDSLQSITDGADKSDADLRSWFRELGRQLHAFYNSQLKEIHAIQPEDKRDAYVAEKMIVILHPRDKIEGDDISHLVQNRVELPENFVLTPPGPTKLTRAGWEDVVWDLSIVSRRVSSPTMRLDFNAELLNVHFEDSPVKPGKWLPLPESGSLRFQVQAARDMSGSPGERTQDIALQVRLGRVDYDFADSVAKVILPLPNRIDLIASCVQPAIEEQPIGKDGVRLQPFPNRDTEFQFELVNQSDTEKHLRVELIAVARPADAAWPPGRLIQENGMPFDTLAAWPEEDPDLLFAIAELKLPADRSRHRIKFLPPGALDGDNKPAAESETAKVAGADKQQEPVFKQKIITHGVLCRLTDQGTGKVWKKWIEVVPRRPRHYLGANARLVRVGDNREVRFSFRLKDLDGDGNPDQPPLIVEQPVELILRSKEILPAGQVNKTIAAQPPNGWMALSLPPNLPGMATLELSVDNFPRAFIWQVNNGQKAGPFDPCNNHSSVRIDWVSLDGDQKKGIRKRTYLLHADAKILKMKAPEKGDQPPPIIRNVNQPCAFNVRHGTRDLQIGLRVDAPPDAFQRWCDDTIKISLKDNDSDLLHKPKSLYYDRNIFTRAVAISKTGGLKIRSVVGDHTLSLETPPVSDKKLLLAAAMWLKGKLVAEDPDRQLVFDARPPSLELGFGNKFMNAIAGGSFTMQPRIKEDLSGIALIEVWILEKRVALKELQGKQARRFEGPFQPPNNGQWQPTLKLKAPEKAGSYHTYLRVTDGSGQSAKSEGPQLKIVPPAAPGPLIADLQGQVKLGNRPAPAGLTVYLQQKPQKKTKTTAKGAFVIPKVPAGKYTLIVKGVVINQNALGKHDIELAKREDFNGIGVTAELLP